MVYLAEDQLLGDVPVAVKFLSNSLLSSKMRDRFEREATTSALLGQRSMHIVRVMDYGMDDGDVPFYVMEYLKGDSLSDLISVQPLSLAKFLVLARQICLGLQCAHDGIPKQGKQIPIVHRDVKPSNILVCQDSTLGDLVKLLDFGISKLLQENAVKQTSAFMGTLAYSSPEQMEGKELDSRSDIYSLGIVFFEMLTCELPVQPETQTFSAWYRAHHFTPPRSLEEVRPKVQFPDPLVDLITSCLAKSASDRPQSVTEVIQVLDALETLTFSNPPQQPSQSQQSPQRATPSPPEPELPPRRPPTARDTTPDAANPKVIDTDFLTRPASFLSPEQACEAARWPIDKPRAQIVFPKILATVESQFVSLFVMLNREEILQRGICTRYNTFLCVQHPHPMILWLTVLYNRDMGPRWLPHYIDLKTTTGQKLTRLLNQQGKFYILLFPVDGDHPEQILVSKFPPFQAHLLLEWANSSEQIPVVGEAGMSKQLLKKEYEEKLKKKTLLHIESSLSTSSAVIGKDLSW
jgi:eukaryotic-like serine/threonine-protein kinase